MPREHGESGEFVETTTLESVRDVFDAVEGPVVLSADVADRLGCTRETARRKLQQLYERGDLDRRKVARRVIYWRRERDGESGRERSVTPAEDPVDQRDESPPTPASTRQEDPEGEDSIGDALAGWEPDTEANPRTARAQTRRVAEWLRSVGEYRRARELKDALAGESSLSERVWWERHARPGLRHLADAGLVEYTKNRGYRWVGDDGEV